MPLRPPTDRQRAFARLVADGASGVDAYANAYQLDASAPRLRRKLATRASALCRKPAVAALIREFGGRAPNPPRASIGDASRNGAHHARPAPSPPAMPRAITPPPVVSIAATGGGDVVRARELLAALDRMSAAGFRAMSDADVRSAAVLLEHWHHLARLEIDRRRESEV